MYQTMQTELISIQGSRWNLWIEVRARANLSSTLKLVLSISKNESSILMLFYYLAPQQSDSIVMSRCMQFTFGDKREVYLLDESVLPVA